MLCHVDAIKTSDGSHCYEWDHHVDHVHCGIRDRPSSDSHIHTHHHSLLNSIITLRLIHWLPIFNLLAAATMSTYNRKRGRLAGSRTEECDTLQHVVSSTQQINKHERQSNKSKFSALDWFNMLTKIYLTKTSNIYHTFLTLFTFVYHNHGNHENVSMRAIYRLFHWMLQSCTLNSFAY